MRRIFLMTLPLWIGIILVLAGCTSADPPVTLAALSLDQTQLTPGQPLSISTSINNPAKKSLEYPLTVKINDQIVDNQTLSLSGGETRPFNYNYIPLTAGTYQIDINGQPASFLVLNPAALAVQSLAVNPGALVPSQTLTFSAEIRNSGDLPGVFTGQFKIDGEDNATPELTVEGGSSQTLSLTAQVSNPGIHTLELADRKIEFKVLKPAEFQASEMTANPERALSGDLTTIEALITNIGEIEDTQKVAFLVNGAEKDSQTLTLSPAGSAKVSFYFSGQEAGFYKLNIMDQSRTFFVITLPLFNNPDYFYSLNYPEEAKMDQSESDTVSFTMSGNCGLVVLVDPVPVASTAKDYFNQIAQGKKQQLPDWTYSNLTEVLEGSQITGYRYDYSNTVEGKRWVGRGLVMKRSGFGYYVVFTTFEPEWESNKKMAERCLSSFKLPEIYSGTYNSTRYGLSLTLPTEWCLIEPKVKGSFKSNIILFSPFSLDSPVTGGLSIIPVAGGVTAETYFKTETDSLSQLVVSQVEFKGTISLKNGGVGYEIIQSLKTKIFDLKIIQIALVKDGQAYVFEFVGTPESIDACTRAIEQMAQTLVLK
jgi:hypothetical protein